MGAASAEDGQRPVLSDAAGAKVESSAVVYAPFGEMRAGELSALTDSSFTGQRLDRSAGELMYYGARYYLSSLRRFISADTIVQDSNLSQMYNRYTYVLNNPVNYNDPTGHVVRAITIDNPGRRNFAIAHQISRQRITTSTASVATPAAYNVPAVTVQPPSPPAAWETPITVQAAVEQAMRTETPADIRRAMEARQEAEEAAPTALLQEIQSPTGNPFSSDYWGPFGKANTLGGEGQHPGIDSRANHMRDPIYSPAYGQVVAVGTIPKAGNYIVIEHEVFGMTRFYSAFFHLDSILVEEGMVVGRGKQIGEMGNSGDTSVHLHFEIRRESTVDVDKAHPFVGFWPSETELREGWLDLSLLMNN